MAYLNQVNLIGNVGQDPAVRENAGGKFASFSLATTERYKDRDGNPKEQTQWHNVTASGPQAEVVEKYIRKGAQVYVGGKLVYRSYEDKEGVTRYATEIRMHTVQMLDRKPQNLSSPAFTQKAEAEDLPSWL